MCQRPKDVLDGQDASRDGGYAHERHWYGRYQRVFCLTHVHEESGGNRKGDGREQLVTSSEQWPDGRDVSRVDQISPGKHDQHRGADITWQPCGVREGLVSLSKQFLENVACYASARIHGSENEKGFEHDRVVIPVAHQGLHAGNTLEYLGHSDGQRNRTTGASGEVF